MRRLIEYLPPFVREIAEYDAITQVEQQPLDNLIDAVDSAALECFAGTASEAGLARWERVLNIVPLASDTIDDRKFRLRARILGKYRINFFELKNKLVDLCGDGKVEIIYHPDSYSILVYLELSTKSKKNQVIAILDELIPAVFLFEVDLKYITHELLSSKSHGQLEAYIHEEMREDDDLKKELGG